jgi:hypothetical protein
MNRQYVPSMNGMTSRTTVVPVDEIVVNEVGEPSTVRVKVGLAKPVPVTVTSEFAQSTVSAEIVAMV